MSLTQTVVNYSWPQQHGVDRCHYLILPVEENMEWKEHVHCPRLLGQWQCCTWMGTFLALTFTYNPLAIYSSHAYFTTSTITFLQLRKGRGRKLQVLWRNNLVIQETDQGMAQTARQNSPNPTTENVRLWSCLLIVTTAEWAEINLKGQ